MKIRYDFVSNSSSSSFVLWGAIFSKNEIIQALKTSMSKETYDSIKTKWMPEHNEFITQLNTSDLETILDVLRYYFSISLYDYGNDEFYIGESPTAMKDDETLLQFKSRISKSFEILSKDFANMKIELYNGINSDGYVELN